MYSSKYLISNYTEFVGYDTCDKLICTSGEGSRNTNKISKQGVTQINNNKIFPSWTLGFCRSPHKDTCNILSKDLVLCIF